MSVPPPLRTEAPALRAIGQEAWGTFLYGVSRPLVQWVAHAFALACDPEPTWVDFRDADAKPDPLGPVRLGKVPSSRLYVAVRSEGRPHAEVPSRTLWTLIRPDEAKESVLELADFLRLPSRVQEAIGAGGGTGPRRVLVVANTDRVREFYPTTIQGIRPFVLTALRANLVPILTSLPPIVPGYLALDHVFEVRGKSLDDWREGSLYCEQAPAGSEFVPRQTFRLTSIPEIVSVLAQPRE